MRLVIGIIMFFLTTISRAQTGGVGVGTNNPKAKLHIAGTLRVDSAKTVLQPKRFAVLDSNGVVQSFPVDSLKTLVSQNSSTSNPTVYYSEIESVASNTSSILQSRVTLTLPPGTYLLTGYCEAFNVNVPSGVRAQVNEGNTEIAYGAVYSDQSTFSPWSMMRKVSITTTTTYSLLWGSWPSGNLSHIRRARLSALKIQ